MYWHKNRLRSVEQNTELRYKPTSGDNYTVTKAALIHGGEKTDSSTNCVGETGTICKRIKWDYSLTPCTKINSRRIDLNIRPETIKTLEEDIGSMFFDISCCNFFFFGYIFSDKGTKAEIKKWDCNKLKIFAP